VVAHEYRQRVLDDFATLGPGSRARFEALTDPPPCPVVSLRRVDVPGAREGAPGSVAGRGRQECSAQAGT
jgi:hypothetical protein